MPTSRLIAPNPLALAEGACTRDTDLNPTEQHRSGEKRLRQSTRFRLDLSNKLATIITGHRILGAPKNTRSGRIEAIM